MQPDARREANCFLADAMQNRRRKAKSAEDEPIRFPSSAAQADLCDETGMLVHGEILENDNTAVATLLNYIHGKAPPADEKIRGALLTLDSYHGARRAHTTTFPVTVLNGSCNHAAASVMDAQYICEALTFMEDYSKSLPSGQEGIEEERWCKAVFKPDPEDVDVALLPRDRNNRFAASKVWGCLKDEIKQFFNNQEKMLGLPVVVVPPGKHPRHDRLFVMAVSSCFIGANPCGSGDAPHAWANLMQQRQPWMHLIKELNIWSTSFLLPKLTAVVDLSGSVLALP